jgi:DNA-directed RNA polymerase III subunit RPC6
MSDETAKINILRDELYDAVRDSGTQERLFTQEDLLDLNIIPNGDVITLAKVIQALTNEKLFAVSKDKYEGVAWRWRTEDESKKYVCVSCCLMA